MSLTVSGPPSSAYAAPVAAASQPTASPPPQPAAVDRPNDGDADDKGAPVSPAGMSSSSTQAALSSLKVGG